MSGPNRIDGSENHSPVKAVSSYARREQQPFLKTCLVENFCDLKGLERAAGIEPALLAWEAVVLPLNYARRVTIDRTRIILRTFGGTSSTGARSISSQIRNM